MYKSCNICERRCGVDRSRGFLGFCGSDATPRVAHADMHMWEEPIISGDRGSGTIFFSGCSLGCVFCQNRDISRANLGMSVTHSDLADIMLSLYNRGAHNINFVTPTHFAPSVIEAVEISRSRGLDIPIVYNTGSYDTVETVKALDRTVDIYLPDYKYVRASTAKKLSGAQNYPEVAFSAISEMVRQRGGPIITDGLMRSGVIVRILLLPNHTAEAKLGVRRIYDSFGSSVYMSLMCQYTPLSGMEHPLDRRVTLEEYNQLVSYAERIGVTNAFVQEPASASDTYIPKFNMI